uniref:Uncharacterized protein n=1 Tax=Caenorhabditis tropicalis TaxID=1561998 RepID=A0A1I7TPE5_9PELO
MISANLDQRRGIANGSIGHILNIPEDSIQLRLIHLEIRNPPIIPRMPHSRMSTPPIDELYKRTPERNIEEI